MENSIINSNQLNIVAENAINKSSASNLSNKKDQELKDVAEQFEAIFVHQMLKQARQGKLAEGLFSSEAQDTFNNMIDIEYSQILSKKNNFGIAEALIKQFQPHLQIKDIK
ncbi:MAG: rod-binding protein [Candidatus Puniceispirillales bacterium]|jgi:Rod binding domain-containing protein|nr:rod-binding protein [Pseudomonadota bacterium]|tara:strand:- start:138 stop:470 length:333 start_codon:yes stop_codon:yes gene_type:complete